MKRSKLILVGLIFGFVFALASAFVHFIAWNRNFMTVHSGMTREEVEDLIGVPREIIPSSSGESWDYGRSWYFDSRVHFNNDGVVKWVESD